MARRAVPWPLRIVRLAACAVLGVVLALAISVGLVRSGLVRSPLAPRLEGDIALASSDRVGMRVLFVGNSMTYQNSTPALVHELAEGDEHALPVFAVQYVAPGWTLRKASGDKTLTGVVAALRWDAVVLQEQSQLPSLSRWWRVSESIPFASDLDAKIDAAGGRTVLFMTWGYRDGDRSNYSGDQFASMQARLARGYSELAAELSAAVAPIGLAWAEALRREPGLDLWASDGKHPSRVGSYLAACVLYATLTGRDPRRSDFTAGLREARVLQDVAADVVRPREL